MFTAIIRKHKGRILLLILLGLAVYGNSLFNGFVWDDEEQIVNNQLVHSLKNLPQLFLGSTFNSGGNPRLTGIYYKPLMSASFAFLYSLFGPRHFFFHLFQLIVHLTNATLVFALFVSMFNKIRPKEGVAISFVLSLIFLVHPGISEAVLYIASSQDVLFFFFGMLALILSLTGSFSIGKFLLVNLWLLFSLLAKETGIIFVILVWIYLFLMKKDYFTRMLLWSLMPLFIYVQLRLTMAGVWLFSSGCMSPIMRLSLIQRLTQIPAIIAFYLRIFFFPKDLAISQHWIVTEVGLFSFYLPLILSLLFWLGGILALILLKKKSKDLFRVFLFFFLWFWLGTGLHLQLITLDMTVAERWFYLPLVGMLGMIGTILTYSIRSQKWLTAVAVGLILALSARTMVRTFDWRSGLILFSHDIRISRGAFDLENNLGVELFRVGKIEEAADHFKRSTELSPCWWTNWNNLGAVWERRGDLGKAEEHYRRAITNSDYYLAYENYALILLKQQKVAAAKDFLEKEGLVKFPFNSRLRALYSYILQQEKL